MSPELIYAALAVGGLLVGWLARHHGIPAAVASTAPEPAVPIVGNDLELLKQLQDFLVKRQRESQTTDVVKQLVEKLTAPKG
jgi:hypothetical protein